MRTAQEENIEAIFGEYKNKVYRLAISMTHNEKDAEDIMQNTFLKVIKNLKYFRHQSEISTWIYKIARNETLMYLRRKYRQTRAYGRFKQETGRIPSGMFINWPKIPDKELLDAELKERIDSAVRRLPIKYRMPLLLHHIEGMPIAKSAEILGLGVNSLKSRLHRARGVLAYAVSDYFKDKECSVKEKEPQTCTVQLGFINDFLENKLDRKTQEEFEGHISDCKDCIRFINSYNRAIQFTGALECRDIPAELSKRIIPFVFRHKKPRTLLGS